ncbi:HNH endonuclease [Enemella evansiae]|uniref:HNH endonuclease n=1 Tax=Enemella evansiae TaxID=2016499 RepID=A0A255GEW2_9ACTN|nr:HNH endonuclease signature motif containing protein [Enemella evansiae]OYO12863.1 HNH endonuclease [Enemella evansiae]
MSTSTAAKPTTITIEMVESILPGADRIELLDPKDSLALLDNCDVLVSLAHALRAKVIAQVEHQQAAEQEHLCSTAVYLTGEHRHTGRRARELVREALELDRAPRVADACRQGQVSAEQARGILHGLSDLPDDLATAERDRAERLMVQFADTHDPKALRRLSTHLWQTIDPDGADEREAARLEAEEKLAQQNRRLTLAPDGMGSMIIAGKLPLADGAELKAVLEAYTQSIWARSTEQPKHQQVPMTRAQARADALLVLVRRALASGRAPQRAGDRPRISVLVSLEKLRAGLGATDLDSGERLSATEVRRLACDAEIIPITLNSNGMPLDVGRSERLVTQPIRAALVTRDRGCVFPGCDRPPDDCEAHHVHPWYFGGHTRLDNLVLLCPHHHRMVEPARDGPWDADQPHRWAIRIMTGIPTIIPPALCDPDRRPRRHARFREPVPV